MGCKSGTIIGSYDTAEGSLAFWESHKSNNNDDCVLYGEGRMPVCSMRDEQIGKCTMKKRINLIN